MGFAVGDRCLLGPYLHHSRFPSSSQSVVLCVRNGDAKKSLPVMACPGQEDPNDVVSRKRRAVLFVGISVLPLLQLRALALQGLATKEDELKTQQDSRKTEQALRNDASQTHVVSLLSGLGWFSSGVLGALYGLSLQEKKAADATIESMTMKVRETEAAMVLMEKNFESKLLSEHEEWTKQICKVKEEEQSLMDKLDSANTMIDELGQVLESEKRVIADLRVEINSLQRSLEEAVEDKRALEENLKEKVDLIESLQGRINLFGLELKEKEDSVLNLNASIREKDSELRDLNSIYDQTKNELATKYAEVEELKHKVSRNEAELESKASLINELNSKGGFLIAERDDSKKRFDAVVEEYNDLKLSYDQKAALDAKLLGERELEIDRLKEKLDTEANTHQAMISDLTQQREDMSKMLELETSKVMNLKHELQITEEDLGMSRNESCDLAEQLRKSTNQCLELEAEASMALKELAEAREITEMNANGELLEVKEFLKKTEEELQIVRENHDNLQKELVDAYKNSEASARELKDEEKVVSSLRKEVEAMEKQIFNDKEAKRSLETDLEEATRSLDEMNRNAMLLSRDLETTNDLNFSLEAEKEMLYKILTEQKKTCKEAQENMEEAHNIAMKLGRERQVLDKKLKKRTEELCSAKGEILRLRSRINRSRVVVNNDEAEATVSVAKRGRRRSGSSE